MDWINRWGYEVSKTKPGIFRMKIGGYVVTCTLTDPKTGRRHQALRVLHGAKLPEAEAGLVELRRDARAQLNPGPLSSKLFATFAAQLFQRKLLAGDIKSAKGKEKWQHALTLYLVPAFGAVECRELRYAHLSAWRDELATWIAKGRPSVRAREQGKIVPFSPHTANTLIAILRVITKAMVSEFDLDRDPARDLEPFDVSDVESFPPEAPNALTAEWARRFTNRMRWDHPQHYMMTVLGFATGLRPSTLRPLRRSGEIVDLDLQAAVLFIRRSHTRKQITMNKPKTGKRQLIHLPAELVALLREHVEMLDAEGIDSPYLFPSITGGMRSPSVLDKPFADVCEKIGLPFKLTPKGMRRTFQDLARAAEVHDVVTRSISGHATEAMQQRYSTAHADEQRAGIAKVVRLFDETGKRASG